jgi:acylphosphatase
MKALRFRVTGRVQGVNYRAGVKRLADRCAVDGWVRNVPDGSVEGRVVGTSDAVDAFVAGLPAAAPHARVDAVDVHPIDPGQPDTGFVVRPDARGVDDAR